MNTLKSWLLARVIGNAAKAVYGLAEGIQGWYQRNGYARLAMNYSDGGPPSFAGLTRDSAMRVVTAMACTRIIAESSAMLPLDLYDRTSETERTKAVDDPLYSLLKYAPNPEMSAIDFRGTLTGHAVTTGNGYARIARAIGNKQRIVGLWPLDPDSVTPKTNKETSRLEYEVIDGANKITLTPAEIFHLRGFGFDGRVGYSMISYGRMALGLAGAADQYTTDFFASDQTPGITLVAPFDPSPEQVKNVKAAWLKGHGPGNRFEPSVIGKGWEIHRNSVSNVDMQFLDLRKLTRHEICALFRVPPHMVADLERSTNNNIEWQGMEFVVHCLGPWLSRWEQAISLSLISPEIRGRRYAEHNLSALLRGDTKSRFEVYALARQWGILNVDEIRALENMNQLPNGQGQVYLNPLNMADARSPLPAAPIRKSQFEGLRALLAEMEKSQ